MNKIKFLISATIITGIVFFYSCSNENENEINNSEKAKTNQSILNKISELESSNLLSEQLLKLDIEKINVSQNNDDYIITYYSQKSFYIDKNSININEIEFLYNSSENKLSLSNSPEYYIVQNENLYYINTPEKIIDLNKENDFQLDKESSLLLLILSDLSTDNIHKGTYKNYSRKYPKSCSFWDQYEVVSLGFTAYQSQMNNYNATHGAGVLGAGCRRMGPPATSCLGDQHFCMTTQSFCCD